MCSQSHLADYCLRRSTFNEMTSDTLSVEPVVVGIDARYGYHICILTILLWFTVSTVSGWMTVRLPSMCHAMPKWGRILNWRPSFIISPIFFMCTIPVFLFDGPNRLSEKQGKKVIAKPHWLTIQFKELINAFGFFVHDVSPWSSHTHSCVVIIWARHPVKLNLHTSIDLV